MLRIQSIGRADGGLDVFGRAFADEHVVLAFDVLQNGVVHLVPADAYGLGIDDARQRNDRHLSYEFFRRNDDATVAF